LIAIGTIAPIPMRLKYSATLLGAGDLAMLRLSRIFCSVQTEPLPNRAGRGGISRDGSPCAARHIAIRGVGSTAWVAGTATGNVNVPRGTLKAWK
jgi:hypothetical protein